MILTYETIARKIDHALLLPTLEEAELIAGCTLARRYEVASVCIKPYAVALAVDQLHGSIVRVGTVVGFPHGGQTTANKLAESIEALESGATEVDMVVNIGQVVGSNWASVEREIGQITTAAHERGAVLKLILETCYLTDDQKIRLCRIGGEVGVDFVKTSTGFGLRGATISDLVLMRRNSPNTVKLKASGGIKDLRTAIDFVELGCERLGLSRTAEILDELGEKLNLPSRDVSRETATRGDSDY